MRATFREWSLHKLWSKRPQSSPFIERIFAAWRCPPKQNVDIGSAVEAARSRNPRLDSSCLDFVRDVLLLKDSGHLFAEQRESRLAFVMRWQQFTGPIVAKGLEDTVLYVYCPLLSLNEVGGNPSPAAVLASDFNQIARNGNTTGDIV